VLAAGGPGSFYHQQVRERYSVYTIRIFCALICCVPRVVIFVVLLLVYSQALIGCNSLIMLCVYDSGGLQGHVRVSGSLTNEH